MATTLEQFANIVKVLKSVYTYDGFIKTKEAMGIWYELLKDIDYPVLQAATFKFMQTSPRVPTPADLRNLAISSASPEVTETDAWNMVRKALRNSAYHAEEEFKALPDVVQRAVGSPDMLRAWATTEDFNESVMQSNFSRTFRAVAEREKTDARTAPQIRMVLEQTAQKMLGAK